ncbi:MAG: hypothetical protein M0Z31_02590 [Clostridia bacterium]|nr:hypothetical protein [Clostridia bacterium]
MNLKKLLIPLLIIMVLLVGCSWGKGAASTTRELLMEPRVSDDVLITTAKRVFIAVMEAEDKALSTPGNSETKKNILFSALGRVAAQPLIKAYEEAWAAQQLGITLTVKKISRAKVVEKTTTQGVVVFQVDGTVNDESGSQPVSDYYSITLEKHGDKWLLANMEIVRSNSILPS